MKALKATGSLLQALDPERGDCRKVFARLDTIRAKPRDDVAEEIRALSV